MFYSALNKDADSFFLDQYPQDMFPQNKVFFRLQNIFCTTVLIFGEQVRHGRTNRKNSDAACAFTKITIVGPHNAIFPRER